MILQSLLFPNPDNCSTLEMFFRPRKDEHAPWYDPAQGAMCFPQWTHLDLNTYFNSFSIAKWRKYTILENLGLRLELRGRFHVQLVHWEMIGNKQFHHVFFEQVCDAGAHQCFDFDIPLEGKDRGVVCCALYALSDDCELFGGAYTTEINPDKLNRIDIAVDICTFRREAFIERNLALLNREILENPDSDLCGHMEVFIADNGQTLDIPGLENERIHIFPNRNAGGSGGFTRGMMEIIDLPKAFSHVLVMDDDVLINTDALVRTYRLLRFLKPEYLGKTLAGAMLRLDNRWKQHECCGTWNGQVVRRGKKSIDLREIKSVLYNEVEFPFDFNAWWYSCIPMFKITNDSLPLPLFIRMDDVEFGLRTGSDILTLNGICLWHEPFAYKFAASMDYYEMRNLMILNAIRRPELGWAIPSARMFYKILGNLVRYRYKECDLLIRGARDFLAGADALMQRDPEALHREILEASDRFLPLDELDLKLDEKAYRKNLKRRRSFLGTARLFIMNGLFLPPKPPTTVDAFTSWPWACYRRKALLNYSELTQRGFVTRRSQRKTLAYLFKGIGMCWKIMRGYSAAATSYREAEPILTSRSFWNEYLKLK